MIASNSTTDRETINNLNTIRSKERWKIKRELGDFEIRLQESSQLRMKLSIIFWKKERWINRKYLKILSSETLRSDQCESSLWVQFIKHFCVHLWSFWAHIRDNPALTSQLSLFRDCARDFFWIYVDSQLALQSMKPMNALLERKKREKKSGEFARDESFMDSILFTWVWVEEMCRCHAKHIATAYTGTIKKNRILNGERMCGENKNGCWWKTTTKKIIK